MLRPDLVTGPLLKRAIQDAVEGQADATIAVPLRNRWIAFRGKLASLTEDWLYLRFPAQRAENPNELMLNRTLQIIIKYRDFRYVGSVSLLRNGAKGPLADCFCAALPKSMKRFERRLLRRVDVPSKFNVRVQICLGDECAPVWAGRAVNLSTGGVQARVSSTLLEFFEPGDIAFVTITFGTEGESFTVYAHFRSGARDGDMALAGFEFGETGSQEDCYKTLEMIGRHLRAFEEVGG
jgi:c-di-GMP-binding flagellar brake protein YcgR